MTSQNASDSASTSIASIVAQNPVIVLVDEGQRNDLFAHIRREIAAFEPDLSSVKGRDAITSFAFKIIRTKTAIDAAGKKLNEEARAKINAVDAARRDARDTLDKMAEQVRRPLTEWEDEQKARIERCQSILNDIRSSSVVGVGETSAHLNVRLSEVESLIFDADEFRDQLEHAQSARDQAILILTSAIKRVEQEEADRAELERLRAESAERQRLEDEKIALAQAERLRIAAEEAEAERVAAIERAAAERAQRESEALARQEFDAAERKHAEALAAERRRADEAEAARNAEAERIQRDVDARALDERNKAAVQARREANVRHRSKIMGEAKTAIIACGVVEPTAKAIVLAIVAGNVPHTSVQF